MKFVCDHFEVISEPSEKSLGIRLVQIIDDYVVNGVLSASNLDLPVLARYVSDLKVGVFVHCVLPMRYFV